MGQDLTKGVLWLKIRYLSHVKDQVSVSIFRKFETKFESSQIAEI